MLAMSSNRKRRVSLVCVVVPKLNSRHMAHKLVTLRGAPASPSSTSLVRIVGLLLGLSQLGGSRAHDQAHDLRFIVSVRERVCGVPSGRYAAGRLNDRDAH